jgi:hypothetical protein
LAGSDSAAGWKHYRHRPTPDSVLFSIDELMQSPSSFWNTYGHSCDRKIRRHKPAIDENAQRNVKSKMTIAKVFRIVGFCFAVVALLAGALQPARAQADRELSSLDAAANEGCCERAFKLCEKPPWLTYKQFARQRGWLLRQAKRACAKIRSVLPSLSGKDICAYYSSPQPNCAYTSDSNPQTYLKQLGRCCELVPQVCEQRDNATLLYNARRECFLYMGRDADSICALKESACSFLAPP